MASDLARATAVRQVASGCYAAELPDDWNYLTPSGGVLMTVAMRAMVAELDDPSVRPMSATTIFCRPVLAGPLEVRVDVLRQGNAATQLRAMLVGHGGSEAGLEVSATFVRERSGPEALGVAMPTVPLPDACPMPPSGASSRRFFGNLDIRLALGAALWDPGWREGEARQAYWYRYRVPQRISEGFDPLAIPPIADTMPSALVRKLGPDGPRFFAPSLDLTVHFLDTTDREWFLVDVRCQRARGGYATADAEIWDDAGRLVAHATQTMMLRKRPKG